MAKPPVAKTPTLALVDDPTKCGAKTKSRVGTCRNDRGFRTTHPGEGRCYLHGGLQEGDRRLKSGRYSTVNHERLRELIEKFEADPDPLNLFPEIAALRAMFVDYVERYQLITEALLAWHADWSLRKRPLPEELLMAFERVVDEWEIALNDDQGEEATVAQRADASEARKFITFLRCYDEVQKPKQVLDISDAHRMLSEIGRMVERVENLRSANAISRPELNRVISAMGRVVELAVQDEAVKVKIRDGWMAIASV